MRWNGDNAYENVNKMKISNVNYYHLCLNPSVR